MVSSVLIDVGGRAAFPWFSCLGPTSLGGIAPSVPVTSTVHCFSLTSLSPPVGFSSQAKSASLGMGLVSLALPQPCLYCTARPSGHVSRLGTEWCDSDCFWRFCLSRTGPFCLSRFPGTPRFCYTNLSHKTLLVHSFCGKTVFNCQIPNQGLRVQFEIIFKHFLKTLGWLNWLTEAIFFDSFKV